MKCKLMSAVKMGHLKGDTLASHDFQSEWIFTRSMEGHCGSLEFLNTTKTTKKEKGGERKSLLQTEGFDSTSSSIMAEPQPF